MVADSDPDRPDGVAAGVGVAGAGAPPASSPALRERVYASLVGLSTVLLLLDYADQTRPAAAAVELAGTMAGLFAAGLVADVVAQSVSAGRMPRGAPLWHAVAVAAQVLEIALVPVLAVALAGTGLWTVRVGLMIAAAAFVLAQVAVSVWAVRHPPFDRARRLVVVLAELGLCALVIVIKVGLH